WMRVLATATRSRLTEPGRIGSPRTLPAPTPSGSRRSPPRTPVRSRFDRPRRPRPASCSACSTAPIMGTPSSPPELSLDDGASPPPSTPPVALLRRETAVAEGRAMNPDLPAPLCVAAHGPALVASLGDSADARGLSRFTTCRQGHDAPVDHLQE